MDLTYPPETEAFRRRLRAVLADSLPTGWPGLGALPAADRQAFLVGWRETLRAHRLLAPAWPREYGGGGLGVLEQSVVAEELVRAGLPALPHPNDGFGLLLLGPTLLHWGTPAQKAYFLPRIVSGEHRWAQGYSEPDAGSDLFGLRTRARLEGDEWVVDGRKIWQTAGVTANWIFALVRTDPAAARSKGLSLLLIPVDQPGVEVRGIRTMAGDVEFAEVAFDGARTAASHVVGPAGAGASVALTLLGYERGTGGVAQAESLAVELDRLVALARAKGVAGDPLVRQAVAACWEKVQVLRCLGLAALTAGAAGAPPGPESSILKLVGAEYRQEVTELAVRVLGTDVLAPTGSPAVTTLAAQPRGTDPLSARAWVDDFLRARPGTVYGGSSEIQRDTIAERVLGLPRSPGRG